MPCSRTAPSTPTPTEGPSRRTPGVLPAPGVLCVNRAIDLALLNLADPTEVRTFEKGRFEVYRVGAATIGRATYEPGWRWSEHIGASTGEAWCTVAHIGLVIS